MAAINFGTNPSRRIMILSFTDYCNNKTFKNNLGFKIKNGKGMYLENGNEVEVAMIDARYPTPSCLFFNEHSSGSHSWQY